MSQNLSKRLQNLRKRANSSNITSIYESELTKANVTRLKQQLAACFIMK